MNIETTPIPAASADIDLFRAYRNAIAAHGVEHAFLLESLQGPEQDCRQSILGLHRLAEVVFAQGTLRIEGCPSVCGPLQAAAAHALGLEPAPLLALRSEQDHWTALRALLRVHGPEPQGARWASSLPSATTPAA